MWRKFLILTFLLVMVASQAAAQDAAQVTVPAFGSREAARAQGIGVDGPVAAEPDSEITLRLVGTPVVDLTKPLIEQLEWLMGDTRMYVYWLVPGQAMRPCDVRGELVFSVHGATMQPLVRVATAGAGEYRLVVDWNHGQHQLAEHRVQVGPGPEPDPPPPPDLVATWGIVVEQRSLRGKLPVQQAIAIDSQRVRSLFKEGRFRSLDVDVPDASPELVPYVERAQGKPLPRLFLVADDGRIAWEGDLPQNTDATVELIGRYQR